MDCNSPAFFLGNYVSTESRTHEDATEPVEAVIGTMLDLAVETLAYPRRLCVLSVPVVAMKSVLT